MLLEVWAPYADRVDAVVGGDRVAMAGDERGWWRVEVAGAVESYAFSLDGGPPRPDPRSPWQPDGVHGPSRPVDHAVFPWTDQRWRGFHLPSAVLYELHVGTFSEAGTFDGVVERLDHLVELGVDAIELMPVVEFPGRRGWGYDGVDLYAPHHDYGGPDGLKRLVDACHARGVGVILDVVYNHLGPAGNYLREFGPYFTDRHHTPWGEAVNVDGAGSNEVRSFIVDNALSWLRDYHMDGLRLDAVHAIVDTSAIPLLEELSTEVDHLAAHAGRSMWLVAESDLNDPRVVRSRDAHGDGIHAQWSDDFHHAIHARVTGERAGYYGDFGSLSDIAAALTRVFVYDGRHSVFRNRRHGRPVGELPGHSFVGYAQNHDQVGNRALGERLSQLVDLDRLKIVAAVVLCSPFVPMLFQGEEWGASTPFQYFTDHDDPSLARAVREGRRREFAGFGWKPHDIPDPQDPSTFERSRLQWAEVEKPPHAELVEWHRSLVALRREWPELTDGDLRAADVRLDGEDVLEMRRGRVTLAINLVASPVSREVDATVIALASVEGATLVDGRLSVPPTSAVVATRP
jgi:maltooligosyltrehalose trehalohydrolase